MQVRDLIHQLIIRLAQLTGPQRVVERLEPGFTHKAYPVKVQTLVAVQKLLGQFGAQVRACMVKRSICIVAFMHG